MLSKFSVIQGKILDYNCIYRHQPLIIIQFFIIILFIY